MHPVGPRYVPIPRPEVRCSDLISCAFELSEVRCSDLISCAFELYLKQC